MNMKRTYLRPWQMFAFLYGDHWWFCRVGVSSGFESRAYSDVSAQPSEGLSTCCHQHVCSHHQVQHERDMVHQVTKLYDIKAWQMRAISPVCWQEVPARVLLHHHWAEQPALAASGEEFSGRQLGVHEHKPPGYLLPFWSIPPEKVWKSCPFRSISALE